jgi:hypothetical protein
MYTFLLPSLISRFQMVDSVQEANTHHNLIEMYPQFVFVPPPPM